MVVQVEKSLGEAVSDLGDSIGYGGKGQILIYLVLGILLSYGLSKVFGQVRSMSLITHMMMMQLRFSGVVLTFFSGVFEYATYDIVPTEEIYSELFKWDNEAFSEEAEMIGYESRFLIENAGSIPIYIIFVFLLQLIYGIILLLVKSGKVFKFTKKQQSSFFWAGSHDLYLNSYLTLAMCACINTSSL